MHYDAPQARVSKPQQLSITIILQDYCLWNQQYTIPSTQLTQPTQLGKTDRSLIDFKCYLLATSYRGGSWWTWRTRWSCLSSRWTGCGITYQCCSKDLKIALVLCPLLNFVTYHHLMAKPDQRPETI